MADESALTRRLFNSGMLVFVGFVFESAIAFVAKVIVARELGRVDYGGVGLGVALLAMASVVSLLGLNKGVARHVSRYDERSRIRGVILSAHQFAVPLSVIVAAALYFGAGVVASKVANNPGAKPVIQVFALAVPFAVGTKLALGAVQGRQLTAPKVLIQNLTIPLVRFSVPLSTSSLISRVLTNIDSFLLAADFGTGPVGDYRVVYPLATS